MKNLFTKTAFYLLLGFLLFLVKPNDVKSQIVSAPAGGQWNLPATWLGGIVPGAGDNVIIASTVSVPNGIQCNNLTIQSGGVLQNSSSNSYTIVVNGNLTNQGVIQNSTYSFYVNVRGNVSNSGSMTNHTLNFTGTANQQISSTQPLQMGNFVRTAGSGKIMATTNLSFAGTIINLNSDTLQFTTGNALTLDGGYLTTGVIYKSALPAFQLTAGNGAYVYNFIIDTPETGLYGSLIVFGSGNVFKQNVFNYGTLYSHASNAYSLSIAGNLTNNGTIQNGTYSFTVNISGDLTNNGIWQNYNTILNGSGAQNLSMTQPYSGTFFTKNQTAGRAIALTQLSFVNTEIDLRTDTLEFTTGSAISIDGGNLRNGVIFKSSLPAIQLTAGNSAYVYILKIDAPQTELYGSLLIFGSLNNFKSNVINNATLESHPTNSYTLIVNGNLTNAGVIQNGVYSFIVNITGNISNNGIWQNYNTVLTGGNTQELAMTQPYSGTFFTKNLSSGRARAVAGLSFVGTQIDFQNDTLEFTTGSTISLVGGNLRNGVLFRTLPSSIQLTAGNDAYVQNIKIDAPQTDLGGSLLINSLTTFKTNVINNSTLKSHPSNSFTLVIDGNLINNGIIKNGLYNFTVNISGNLTNNGSFKNYLTNLTGANNRSIAFSKRFEGTNFTKSAAAGNITATTDLIFDGVAVDLNGTLLTLPDDGYLSVLNGSFGDAIIAGNNIHFNTLAGYCFSTQFSTDVSLHGIFQAAGGISFAGSIVNQGTLRSYSNNAYSFSVAGDLENNGSIVNGFYNLTLTILGDITNNGNWSNYQTILDGVADQYIYLNNTITGRILLDANNTGTGNWFGPSGTLVGNSNFSGATAQVLTFLVPVTSSFEGQYYRTGSSGNSRNIYINTPASPARLLTMNFLLEGLYLSGGTMRASLDGSGNPVFGASIADQVSIELHENGNFSNVLFTKESALLSTNGTVSFTVPGNFSGSYYLAVRHRSGIITVSANPVAFNVPVVSYSFDQLSKAYGSNMATTYDGWFAFYGGDVNQDGYVDTGDMTPVDNESAEFAVGYRNPDANADGVIDTADMTIVDNNSANFISAVYP